MKLQPKTKLASEKSLWQVATERALRCTSIVADEAILLGDESGTLTAFRVQDGTSRWCCEVSAAVQNQPAVEGDRVVVGTKAGDVIAFDLATGDLRWRYATGAPGTGAPTITDGVVTIGDALGRLHALDLRDGRPVWCQPFQAEKRIGAAPVVGRGMVIVGSYDGAVYALDAVRGTQVWRQKVGGRVTTGVALSDHWAYAGTHDGRILKLDLFAGRVQDRWTFTAGGPILSDVVLSPDRRVVYTGSGDGHLHGVDVQTTAVRCRFSAAGAVAAAPVFWEGVLFFGSIDGSVYALDAERHEELWRFEAGSAVMGLAVADGIVYVTAREGSLFALPWHLGQWERVAAFVEAVGRRRDAATFYARAGKPLEARRLLHYLGDFTAAAEVMESAGERTEAAEDYRRAGERAQRRGAEEEAAELYERAADLFAEIRCAAEVEECRRAAVRCRRAPFLRIDLLNRPALVVGEAATLQFRFENIGYSKARGVRARVVGPCECHYLFQVPEMAPGRAVAASFEGCIPNQAGQGQLFRLLLHYRASDGRLCDYQMPLRLSVRAPEQPPVHVDEVIVVQGPMTRVAGDVGTVKQEGEPGLVDVEGDAGMVVQRPGLSAWLHQRKEDE